MFIGGAADYVNLNIEGNIADLDWNVPCETE